MPLAPVAVNEDPNVTQLAAWTEALPAVTGEENVTLLFVRDASAERLPVTVTGPPNTTFPVVEVAESVRALIAPPLTVMSPVPAA